MTDPTLDPPSEADGHVSNPGVRAAATARRMLPTFRGVTDPSVAMTGQLADNLDLVADTAGRSFGDQLQSALRLTASSSRRPAGGLPLPPATSSRPGSTAYRAVAVMDVRGRLGDRSTLRFLGWRSGHRITIAAVSGVVVVVSNTDGRHSVTRQGHLRLPADIRHACHLAVGDRLLILACPDPGLLVACAPAAVDAMVLAYARGLERLVS
jgi:hypothetical protein